jgi:uncharacterized membrane protein required for colicin V production
MNLYAEIVDSYIRGRDRGFDYLRRHFIYICYVGIVVGVFVASFIASKALREARAWLEPRQWGVERTFTK